MPSRLLALLLPLALAAAPTRLDFGPPTGDGQPPAPWAFKRWWPVLPVGDYAARVRVVPGASAGLPGAAWVLRLDCAEAGFLLGRPFEGGLELSATPVVSWSWRADRLPEGGDFRSGDTNDQVLQLLFGFEGHRVVSYVWDSTAPAGASGSGLSWQDDVRVLVLESGTAHLGQWVSERRDLAADFRRLFGEPAPRLLGVAVQSNAQHTHSSGLGWVGPITLSPATAGGEP